MRARETRARPNLSSFFAINLSNFIFSRKARRLTPWVRKFCNLCIQEILLVTWPYVRPTTRPSAPQARQYKITQSTGMATQMQLKVLFGRKSYGRPDFQIERERKKKTTKKNKVGSFSTLFLIFTLTWITEKELERVIENEGDEFRWKKNMKIS